MKPLFVFALTAICFFTVACGKNDCNRKQSSNCVCIEIYAPVCGCDGRTYGNSCEAECNGITDYRDGTCGL